MKKYLRLMRIKHYIKNILVFVPLIFSKQITNIEYLKKTALAFIIFSLTASVVYIINDIRDIEKDRKHETKCKRPLASGEISIKNAIILMIILLAIIAILTTCVLQSFIGTLYLMCYLVMNILYSMTLKKYPIIDVTILMLGFLIRVLFGAAVIDVEVSSWLYLTVISFSYYLAFGKRKGEYVKSDDKKETRDVLEKYSYDFLNKSMGMFLTLTIVFYSLWAATPHNPRELIWTIPLLLIICLKYSLNIETNNYKDGDPVEVLLGDKVLLIAVIIFVIITGFIIYF